jgi:multidrug resistance efflux pump
MNLASVFLLSAVAFGSPSGASTANANTGEVQLSRCLVSLIEDVQVPALEAGPLAEVHVGEGALVRQGERLATIDDRHAQLQKLAAERERDAARARADNDIEVQYSQAAFEVADAELRQNEEINARAPGSVPVAELRRLKLTRRRAELQIDKSRLDQQLAGMTAAAQQVAVDVADESIRRRQIDSPIDGMVVALLHRRGEWVSAGEPVARVVRIDRMWVEGFLSAADFDPAQIDGQAVEVRFDLARQRTAQLPGKVVFVSPLVQAGNKFRVRAEVVNRMEQGQWLLRPGTEVDMTISLGPPQHADTATRRRGDTATQ